MTNHPLIKLLLMLLLVAPCMAQKVTVDYADDYDFSELTTFQYVDTPDSNHPSGLMDERIQQEIVERLVDLGLTQTDGIPSLFVTYHLATENVTTYDTVTYGYGGYRYGWGRFRYGATSVPAKTTSRSYTEGTLIVDAYDGRTRAMVWQGTGTVTLKDDPAKQRKQITRILDKIGKRWNKIKRGIEPSPEDSE